MTNVTAVVKVLTRWGGLVYGESMETNTTTTTPFSADLLELLTQRAKTLRNNRNRHNRWFALCDALTAARDTPAEAEALEAWRKGRCPSKASKYYAYDDARVLQRAMGVTAPDGVAGTRAEWDWTLDRWAEVVGR